jgi:carbon-monoxide dehydrogenase large subunit
VTTDTTTRGWIGVPLARAEDERFLKGDADYVGDLRRPNMLHAVFVRSPYSHAKLRAIDAQEARAAAGVHAVLTSDDVADMVDPFPVVARAGADLADIPHPVLARERVRYVGEPVAAVIAESAEQAADAAEHVILDLQELPPLLEARAATGAPPLHDQAPDNVMLRWRHSAGDVAGAFAQAHKVVRAQIGMPRLIAAPLEPRAVLADYDATTDLLTLWLSAQDQHRQLSALTTVVRRSPERLRVTVPDVGGAFGSKGVPQAETVIVALAAHLLGRPVKWVETRTENTLAVYQGRGLDTEAELALDAEGTMLALRARITADLGAYLLTTTPVPALTAATLLTGCYAIPAAEVEITGVCTTKVPTGPYRGAGRPEAALVIERLADLAAAELDLDRISIRRRNIVPTEAFPYRTPLGSVYDSGDYHGALDAALELADWEALLAQRARARSDGQFAGVGVALYVERVGPGWETAALTLDTEGIAVLRTGSSQHGQGHETTFAQIVADELGLAPAAVKVRWGDSFEIPEGTGTFASRSVTVGGSAALLAARQLRARLAAGESPPLEERSRFELEGPVFSFGAYVATLEIDPHTCEVRLGQIVAIDDCGRVVNPLLADGQVLGAVAQAVGECLYEQVGYAEDGTPLAVNLYDYHLPTAQSMPLVSTALRQTPSPLNPLGAKGIGEGGSIGTPAAIANAVADALGPLGIRHLDPPYTPSRVWEAIRLSDRKANRARS